MELTSNERTGSGPSRRGTDGPAVAAASAGELVAGGPDPVPTLAERVAVLEGRLARLESMVRHASANLDAHMWEEFA